MKNTNSYLKVLLLIGLLSFNSVKILGQPTPEFNFQSPVLLSGTLNAVGSVYRFNAVKPGVDAIVTITNAVNATVAILDQTAAGGGGYDAAFQPNITVTKMTTGYVDFNIDFVNTGTFTLMTQTSINVTALDIDGYNYAANQKLYEFEQFDMGAASTVAYYFNGTDLAFSYVGTAIRATNVGGVEYGAINTSQNVRFTMYTPYVSNLKVRSGATNQDVFNNVTRQRSFYFARFNYTNIGVLAKSDLQSFSGNSESNSVQLKWKFVENHKLSRIEIERSGNNYAFEKISDLNVYGGNDFSFIDNSAVKGTNYYRLKMVEFSGGVTYSNILNVTAEKTFTPAFSVFPTIVTNQASMSVYNDHASRELLSILDANGKVLVQKVIDIPRGTMVLGLSEIGTLNPGNYFITLSLANKTITQRIIKMRN